jgi:hypothetical protein
MTSAKKIIIKKETFAMIYVVKKNWHYFLITHLHSLQQNVSMYAK